MHFFKKSVDKNASISNDKEAFLAAPQGIHGNDSRFRLAAKDVSKIFSYYTKKHNIRLIKNGEFSSQLIEKNKETVTSLIEAYSLPCYAKFLKDNMLSQGFRSSGISLNSVDYPQLYEEVQNNLKEYLNDRGTIKQDLSLTEMETINDLCQKNLSAKAKKDLDELIENFLNNLYNKRDNACLTKRQVVDEVKRIQAELKEDEIVGYLFTNNNSKGAAHFEPLIITKNAVIKPVEWPQQPLSLALNNQDFVGMEFYSPNLGSLLGDDNEESLHSQQTDGHHCGILSISYLKKLLQNNAQELREGSLMFSFYDEEGNIKRFFMPSPTVLQYSQSSKFLKLLPQLLSISEQKEEQREDSSFSQVNSEDDSLRTVHSEELNTEISNQKENFVQETTEDLDEEYIEEVEEEIYLFPIENALRASLAHAQEIKDETMIKHLTDTLEKLPTFTERWLAGYEIACKKRALMTHQDRYIYLSYAAKRMQDEIAQSPVSEAQNDTSIEPSSPYSF